MASLIRLASRSLRPAPFRTQLPIARFQSSPVAAFSRPAPAAASFTTTTKRSSGSGHEDETYEEFSSRYAFYLQFPGSIQFLTCNLSRYEKEFDSVQDVFELQVPTTYLPPPTDFARNEPTVNANRDYSTSAT